MLLDPIISPIPDRFDLAQAHREGWTLMEGVGPSGMDSELRGLDRPDHEAWADVVAAARTGSAYHRAALLRLSEPERFAISCVCGDI